MDKTGQHTCICKNIGESKMSPILSRKKTLKKRLREMQKNLGKWFNRRNAEKILKKTLKHSKN